MDFVIFAQSHGSCFPLFLRLYAKLSNLASGASHLFTVQMQERYQSFHLTLGKKMNECTIPLQFYLVIASSFV